MKLFTTLTAAFVGAAAVLSSSPARSEGWHHYLTTGDGSKHYIRNVSCSGPICQAETATKFTSSEVRYITNQINCRDWTYRYKWTHVDQVPKHVPEKYRYDWYPKTWVIEPGTPRATLAELMC